MAKVDDFEIDIEGDFDAVDNNLTCNADDLPSEIVNLLPEYTNPPWMLDQGWSSDHYIDEKSKATIEKMLREEQHFVNGKQLYSSSLSKRSQSTSNRKPWSEEEKALFTNGLKTVGDNWSKMADLIPTRTHIQIRNYARQYFKKLVKSSAGKSAKDLLVSSNQLSTTDYKVRNVRKTETRKHTAKADHRTMSAECLKHVLQSVTTAQPTVKTTSPKSKIRANNAAPKNKTKQKTSSWKGKQTVSPAKKRKYGGMSSHDLNLSSSQSNDSNPIQNLDSFCDANGILQSESTKQTKPTDETDEEDVDIDIEIDDGAGSPISNKSHSPDSIYKSLLESAEISESSSDSEGSNDEMNFLTEKPDNVDSNNKGVVFKKSVFPKGQSETLNVEKSITESLSASPNCTSDVFDKGEELCDVKSEDNCDTIKNSSIDVPVSSSCDVLQSKTSKKYSRHIVNGFLSVDGKILEFPIPEKELCLSIDEISEDEQKSNSEFFNGKPTKTPERYKKIRNFILDAWNKCKPDYLNKTAVRSGLKNCGDVNCIGRIHSYLECVGAINFGCEQANYRNPMEVFPSKTSRYSSRQKKEFPKTGMKLNGMRSRKRRVKDASGNWVDEKDLEGRTIQHKDILQEKQKPKTSKVLKKTYDPFKLIPCSAFSQEKKSPFSVEIFSSVLSVMDVHAHISKTEVIGLLGGHYEIYTDNLVISMVEPCRSLSTGMQCEMDPVSQIQACQSINRNGLDIVGWYHSHPNFAPNPSIRDIETQKKYQKWFSQDGSLFVGIIVSPYYNMRIISDIQCLTISQEVVENWNIPYKFDYQVTEDTINEGMIDHITQLSDSHFKNHSRVDLAMMYTPTSGVSCLQKMMSSLDSYWFERNILELHQTVQELFTKREELKDTNPEEEI